MLQRYKQMGKTIQFVLFLSLGEPYSPLGFGPKNPGRIMAFQDWFNLSVFHSYFHEAHGDPQHFTVTTGLRCGPACANLPQPAADKGLGGRAVPAPPRRRKRGQRSTY